MPRRIREVVKGTVGDEPALGRVLDCKLSP
jgi:hypothetical protein